MRRFAFIIMFGCIIGITLLLTLPKCTDPHSQSVYLEELGIMLEMQCCYGEKASYPIQFYIRDSMGERSAVFLYRTDSGVKHPMEKYYRYWIYVAKDTVTDSLFLYLENNGREDIEAYTQGNAIGYEIVKEPFDTSGQAVGALIRNKENLMTYQIYVDEHLSDIICSRSYR